MFQYKILITSIALFASIHIMAQSIPDKSHECSGELVVPSITCINPNGGNDVRLYMEEFQTCQDGNITNFDRSILGMNNTIYEDSSSEVRTIFSENIDIDYSENRILIDEKDRTDNLSFILPTKAILHDEGTEIEMIITDQMAPDYEDADTFHFIGKFTKTQKDGKISRGELNCSINN